jgi:hypothetical protein
LTAPSQAKALLEQLRRVPNPTPAKLLAEFRRLMGPMVKGKAR